MSSFRAMDGNEYLRPSKPDLFPDAMYILTICILSDYRRQVSLIIWAISLWRLALSLFLSVVYTPPLHSNICQHVYPAIERTVKHSPAPTGYWTRPSLAKYCGSPSQPVVWCCIFTCHYTKRTRWWSATEIVLLIISAAASSPYFLNSSSSAIKFYEKQGFERIVEIPNYYVIEVKAKPCLLQSKQA